MGFSSRMVGQTDVCPTNFMSAQALRQTEYCANDIKRRFRNKLHISANMGACLSRQAS